MTNLELSADALAVIEKVRKLLALAENNDNEHQAAAAANKAQELLDAYNLDMASIGPASGKDTNTRSKEKRKGGLYAWQRELWNAVAELNFCRYWFIRGLERGSSYQHQILGTKANVVGTEVMATYLQQTVDRLAKEYGQRVYPGRSVFIRELIAYREGIAQRLVERLRQARADKLEEERRKKAEEEAKRSHPAYTPSTAVALVDVIQSEADLNNDFHNGWEPGTTARNRYEAELRRQKAREEHEQQIAADAAAKGMTVADYKAKLAADHEARMKEVYEKWAKQDERNARRREQRTGSRYGHQRERAKTAREERAEMHTFSSGYNKGDEVSLNRQVDRDDSKKLK